MTTIIDYARNFGLRVRARALHYVRNRRGNVAAIIALSLVPLAGVMGLAAEGSNWLLQQRAQQNAADASVVAAANQALQDFYQSNGANWSSTKYQTEGAAVATKYGYTTNVGNATVTVTTASCPPTASVSGLDCFSVTIQKPFALYLSHLVGFGGNTTLNGGPAVNISASALAGPVAEQGDVCLLTLGNGSFKKSKKSDSFAFNGSKGINLGGCPVGSEDNMTCNGSDLQAPWGIAGNGGADNGCGNLNLSQTGPIVDPYASLASHIPTNNCGDTSPGSTTGSFSLTTGSTNSPQVNIVCGTLSLPACTGYTNGECNNPVNVSGTQTWIIVNGTLNLNGNDLNTTGSGGLTIIFTSPNLTDAQAATTAGVGYITDSATGGGFSISAPATPTVASDDYFSGVTIYQDPTPWGTGSSETNYTETWDGNSSKTAWDLSGAAYFPDANMTFNGAVDKAGNGYECFTMVANSIVSNGGANQANLFATDMSNPLAQCGLEGTKTPYANGYRYALVG